MVPADKISASQHLDGRHMSSATQSRLPLVSVGMPVYNEAGFLDEALCSLPAQDYSQIEFIISDNGSTDETPEICNRAAASDPRVRVLRSEANAGATANFGRCLDEAKGELFLWAGGHDLWSSNMISQCVEALETHPGAVIAVPESGWIDASSQPFGVRASVLDTRGMDPLARVFTLLWANMHPIYGVMRTSALRASGPIPNFPGADLILLVRLILQGDFVPAHNALWSRRQTRARETHEDRQRRYKSSHFKINKTGFPVARLSYELVKIVWSSKLALSDKLAFTLAFPSLLPARYLVARRRVA